MARIRVISPDGKTGTIPEGPLPAGFKAMTEASEHPIRAAVSSGISAATFGASDELLSPSAKEGAQRLRAENPTASTIGEVAGSVAGLAAIPELGLSGTAAKVGRIAFEGGMMGLGHQISEAALTDKPINAELLAADVATGALTNLAFVGALHGAGKLASKAAGKAGEIAATDTFKNAASGIRENMIKGRLGVDEPLYKAGEKLGLFDATTAGGVSALADESARRAGNLASEAVDKVATVLPDVKPLYAEWSALANQPPTPASIARMSAIESEFKTLAERSKDTVHKVTRAEHEAEQAARALDHKAEQKVAREAHELAQANKASEYYSRAEAAPSKLSETVAGKGQAKKAAQAPEELVIEPFVEKPFVPEAYRDPAVPMYSQAFVDHAADFHTSRQVYQKAVIPTEPFDLAGEVFDAGILSFFSPKAAAAKIGGKYIKKLAKDHAPLLMQGPLKALAEGTVLPRVAKAFEARVNGMLETAPGMLGPFGAVLSHAAAEGTDALMAAHSKLVQGPNGGEYLAKLGLRAETPEETRAYGQKLAVLEAIERQRASFDKEIDSHVSSFFAGESPKAEKTPKFTTKQLEAQLKSIKDALRDPSKLTGAIPSDVSSGAPGLSLQSGQQATAALKFLLDRAPKPDDSWKPKALQRPFEPSPGDLERYHRYVEAVSNPKAVALRLAQGRPNPEGVEVMKTLYPALFNQLQNKVMANLVAQKKPLSYEKKTLLAQTFGAQILGQNPQQALYLQSVHQARAQQGQEPQGPSTDGRQMVNSNKNMQTQNQRIESRGQNAKTQP
jgi:hypothetical protein